MTSVTIINIFTKSVQKNKSIEVSNVLPFTAILRRATESLSCEGKTWV